MMPLDPDQTNANEQKKVWFTGCFATLMAILMAAAAWAAVFFVGRKQESDQKPPSNPFGKK